MLYHLSSDANLKLLTPKIPNGAVPEYEEMTTPRVCFSDTIEGCLSAVQIGDGQLYVYTPVDEDIDYYIPSNSEVYDAFLTGEVWILKEVEVKCLGKIDVKDPYITKNTTNIINRAGEEDIVSFHCFDWRWLDEKEEV